MQAIAAAGVFGSWAQRFRQVQATRLVLLPFVTGALTGAATIGFVELLNLVQWLAIGSIAPPLFVLPKLSWYHIVLAPAVGGLIVGPLVRFSAPEAEGHGVPEVIEAVLLGGGRIRRRVALIKSLASALTIGSGGSVGREGPIVQIGAAVGSALGQVLRLPAEQLKTLAACGAAGGIAAVFNAPMAGAFFALEVVVGNFAMPAFGPVILSSVMATVVSRTYFGDHPAFIVQAYRLQSVGEIPLYLGLGVLCGAVAAAFVGMMDLLDTWVPRLPVPKIWRPAMGGLVLGVIILAVPNMYGVGYATMDAALSGQLPWTKLIILIPVKILATTLTLASGGSGGVFLPSLYIGSVTGGLYGTAVHSLFPHATANSGAYALVGMAGVLSAATYSPITAILLLFEVSGDYEIILPVMIVSTVATLAARAFTRDSLYTLQFTRRGIALHRREDLIMRSHTVAGVMRPAQSVVAEHTPIEEIVQLFFARELMQLYVTAADGQLVGAISIHHIKDPEIAQLGSLVLARDIAESAVHTVNAQDTLAECMDEFILSEHDELPVVDTAGRLAGVVSRRDVLRVYSRELLRQEHVGVRAGGTPSSIRLAPGLALARVPVPTSVIGSSLRAANLRTNHNLIVVAVQRDGHGEDQLPDPDATLGSRDVLVVVGREGDVERLRAEREHASTGAAGPR